MQNLINDLKEALKDDERLVIEGNLNKAKIEDLALNLDVDLIKLLLKNDRLKQHFFQEADGILIFDKIKFQKFISNKSFLPDSYTAFKNKIGLTANEQYIAGSKEVVLAWPHKDCLLEGGQDKEDIKRDEIFWNEILAPDDIDRLLNPKVLTGWKKYEPEGNHLIESISKQENYFINGNNLLVLHSLAGVYREKVKLVYIDPPFNTGKDTFLYNDRFSQSTWLTFMKSRLEICKELLDKDGNIFIHIDDNQCFELKVLLDEVFGKNNFVEAIIWAYGTPSGGRAAGAKLVGIHDYILHYAKEYSSRKQYKIYTPYSQKYIDDWFKYTDEKGRQYRRRMIGKDEDNNSIWDKQYLDESPGMPGSTVWADIKQIYADPRAYKENQKEHSEIRDYDTQKPEALIKRIIEYSTEEGDLVLDFFVGSGTTAAVSHKMKRRWIAVEQLHNGAEVCLGRLHDVLKGEQTGISNKVNWQGGGSFIFCELQKANQLWVDKIQLSKSSDELKELWKQMQEKAFVSYKVDVEAFDKATKDFEGLPIDEQRKFLIEVLDKNLLYVNYSEIDDQDFYVSEEDKKLNHLFYSLSK